MYSEKAIAETKQTYKEEYGRDITDAEAEDLLRNLLTFYDQIYNRIKKEWVRQNYNDNKFIQSSKP